MGTPIRSIALIGEYVESFPPHAATAAAIRHSAAQLDRRVQPDWVSTAAIDTTLFERYQGLWILPGSPYKDMERTLWAIKYAREHDIPCFGTCGGFQHMVIEYARHVLGFEDAQHAEYDPYASRLFISALECSLAGREMRLKFVPGSRVAGIYGAVSATEQYYCNFGVNPDCVGQLGRGPLLVSGADEEGEVRVIEHPHHRFFVGTLYVPQARSTETSPHPLVSAFLASVF